MQLSVEVFLDYWNVWTGIQCHSLLSQNKVVFPILLRGCGGLLVEKQTRGASVSGYNSYLPHVLSLSKTKFSSL